LVGEKVIIYLTDDFVSLGEMFLNRDGLLMVLSYYSDWEDVLLEVLELVLESIRLPLQDNKWGYDYQSGPYGFLQIVVEAIDSMEYVGMPLYGDIEAVEWCPFNPRRVA